MSDQPSPYDASVGRPLDKPQFTKLMAVELGGAMKSGYIEDNSAHLGIETITAPTICALCEQRTNEGHVPVHDKPVCYACLQVVLMGAIRAGVVSVNITEA